GLAAAADELFPTLYLGPRTISNLFRGLGGGAGANMGDGGDSIGGSGGKGIWAVVKTKGIMVMQ
nr:hypothetical protein [Tanacetum cinerariifolium]